MAIKAAPIFLDYVSLRKKNFLIQKMYKLWYTINNIVLLKLEVNMSKFSYKKLFKKLIDEDMKNNELMEKANISKTTFYKIKNGSNVTTDILLRICDVLDCDVEDIMERVKN